MDLSHTTSRRQQAVKNLSSGSREDLRLRDSGSFSMNTRMNGHVAVERKLLHNMQNLLSYSELQDGKLSHMADLANRMSELASMSTDVMQTESDRSNYNREFLNLVDQFNDIQNETFNNIKLFGNGTSEETQELLNSLKTHWLAATEKLVQEEYGWTADSGDSWDLVIEENGAVGGSAAFVRSSWGYSIPANPATDYASEVVKLSIDLPDLTAPHTVGNSTADTLIAHEMVHLLQAQNTYMGDQAGGDPSRDMTWLAEGLAEFIRGADYRANTSINSLGVAALLQKPNSGWGSQSDDYAGAYLAVKYLDNQIRSSGATAVNGVNANEGIKHLTTWMKAQRDANAGASASGLNQYIETHLNATHGYGVGNSTDTSGQAIDDFIADLESVAGGQAYVNGLNLTDTDTGSVHGSEYGGAVKDSAAVVSDDASYISGFTSQLTYEEEEVEDPQPIELGGGVDLNLSAINPVSFGDISTYNLETENGAKLVMDRVDELIEIITNSLAQVGSNMGAIERSANIVNMRQSSLGNAISRVNEISLPEESMHLAKSDILINSNLMMRAQAKAIQQDVMLTLIS